MEKKKSWWKITLKVVAIIMAVILTVLGSYVLYITLQYSRIEDNFAISIENNKTEKVKLNENLKVSTYNIGFGAYTQEFSFFMDTGRTLDGKDLCGTGSVAKNLETVEKNTIGSINTIKDLNVDFALFQEVDVKATRSHHYNQYNAIKEKFADLSSSISMNFHSAFLFYPIFNPHGKTDAGIVTLSKYNVSSAVRRSLPIDESFPTKFFDLDRCFQITRMPVENSEKEFVLINVHLSAYDEGGKVRAKQLEMLNSVLKSEYELGNYVVVGGDFNHDIANSKGKWQTNREVPVWTYTLTNENLTTGYRFATSDNAPTCRSTDAPYVKGESFTVVLDGFICSENVEIVEVTNIDTDFMYSDHNPASLTFKLI